MDTTNFSFDEFKACFIIQYMKINFNEFLENKHIHNIECDILIPIYFKMCNKYLKTDMNNNIEMINENHSHLIHDEYIFEILKYDHKFFHYLKNRSDENCMKAITINSKVIEFIEEPTYEMVVVALNDDIYNLHKIAYKSSVQDNFDKLKILLSKKAILFLKMINASAEFEEECFYLEYERRKMCNNPPVPYESMLQYITCPTDDMIFKAIEVNGGIEFQYIKQFQEITEEMIEHCCNHNPYKALVWFDESLLTSELTLRLVNNDKNNFEFVNPHIFTVEQYMTLCEEIYNTEARLYMDYAWIDREYIGEENYEILIMKLLKHDASVIKFLQPNYNLYKQAIMEYNYIIGYVDKSLSYYHELCILSVKMIPESISIINTDYEHYDELCMIVIENHPDKIDNIEFWTTNMCYFAANHPSYNFISAIQFQEEDIFTDLFNKAIDNGLKEFSMSDIFVLEETNSDVLIKAMNANPKIFRLLNPKNKLYILENHPTLVDKLDESEKIVQGDVNQIKNKKCTHDNIDMCYESICKNIKLFNRHSCDANLSIEDKYILICKLATYFYGRDPSMWNI